MADDLKFKWYDYVPITGYFTFYSRNKKSNRVIENIREFNAKCEKLTDFYMIQASTSFAIISLASVGLMGLLK